MATKLNIEIRRNRTSTFIWTVSNVPSWDGLYAHLYIGTDLGITPLLDIACSITPSMNRVSGTINVGQTVSMTGPYEYEMVVYKPDLSYVKTAMYGKIKIGDVVKIYT